MRRPPVAATAAAAAAATAAGAVTAAIGMYRGSVADVRAALPVVGRRHGLMVVPRRAVRGVAARGAASRRGPSVGPPPRQPSMDTVPELPPVRSAPGALLGESRREERPSLRRQRRGPVNPPAQLRRSTDKLAVDARAEVTAREDADMKAACREAVSEGMAADEFDDHGCLCRFGIIGDIQYADCDDGSDFSGYQRRHFRNTLDIVRNAVHRWVEDDHVDVLTLGDAIDGRNAQLGRSEEALETVMGEFPEDLPRCDMLGNHELYNYGRKELLDMSKLFLRGDGMRSAPKRARVRDVVGGDHADSCYFSFSMGSRWEIICLDSYDVATIGYPVGDPKRAKAEALLMTHNPMTLIQGMDWFNGVPVEKHRYVPYNGGVSSEQLAWFRRRLRACYSAGRKAIVVSHVPILQASTTPKTVLWNAEDVIGELHSEEGQCVVAVFAGHDHDGGYAVDALGIHHVTFLSPLICKPGSVYTGSATVNCYEDFVDVVGHGVFCSESGTRARGRGFTRMRLHRQYI